MKRQKVKLQYDEQWRELSCHIWHDICFSPDELLFITRNEHTKNIGFFSMTALGWSGGPISMHLLWAVRHILSFALNSMRFRFNAIRKTSTERNCVTNIHMEPIATRWLSAFTALMCRNIIYVCSSFLRARDYTRICTICTNFCMFSMVRIENVHWIVQPNTEQWHVSRIVIRMAKAKQENLHSNGGECLIRERAPYAARAFRLDCRESWMLCYWNRITSTAKGALCIYLSNCFPEALIFQAGALLYNLICFFLWGCIPGSPSYGFVIFVVRWERRRQAYVRPMHASKPFSWWSTRFRWNESLMIIRCSSLVKTECILILPNPQ